MFNCDKDIEVAQRYCTKAQSVKSKGGVFNLPLGEAYKILTSDVCAYTGLIFKDMKEITFERVNPFLGYVSGNVVAVTVKANNTKSLLDSFVKNTYIPDEMKIKLLRKAVYLLEKRIKEGE